MSIRFRLLTEADVKAVVTMDDLIETMASALLRFSTGRVTQPVRTVIPVANESFFGTMPALVRTGETGSVRLQPDDARSGERSAALGAKLVTLFGSNSTRGMPTHLATIVLLDPETGALIALLDGRYITEARTAAVSAVSSRLLARKNAGTLAIIGSGVQARSHLDALSRVHKLRHVSVWSPNKQRRDQFVAEMTSVQRPDTLPDSCPCKAVDHAGEAIVGADLIVLATSSAEPVIESGWVKPGAHVMSVGACRPNQREMDPALTARSRLFVDSRAAALAESGDVVMGMAEGRFDASHVVAELGELMNGSPGRESATDITIFKSLGLAVEDVTAADLAYRHAVERGIGQELTL